MYIRLKLDVLLHNNYYVYLYLENFLSRDWYHCLASQRLLFYAQPVNYDKPWKKEVHCNVNLFPLEVKTMQLCWLWLLKMISSPYCALWTVCLSFFSFVSCKTSCKTSQNVNILQLLNTWSNSEFRVNLHYGCEASWLCFFSYHLTTQLCSCKNQCSCWKKNLKRLKDKVCWS